MVDVLLDRVSKRYGEIWAVRAVTLRIDQGEAVVLLGPTGSGKTTILRLIAGLEQPTNGDVLFDGVPAPDEPDKRNVSMLFADNRLNPRMSARTNIGFPLTVRSTPEPEKTHRVEAEAGALGIENLLERKPHALSAGQSNLVNLAKAMVRAPGVFLIDEPLGAVDSKAKRSLRSELRTIQTGYGATAVYATHDYEDAMTLGDRLVILNDGAIAQSGTPEGVYSQPDNVFVATFLGIPEMSVLDGRRIAGGVAIGELTLRAPSDLPSSVLVGVRPERWERASTGLAGRVTRVEDLGTDIFVHLESDGGDVTMRWPGSPPEMGEVITIRPKVFHLFDAVTRQSVYHS